MAEEQFVVGINDEQLAPLETPVLQGQTYAIDELLRNINVTSLADEASVSLDARLGKIFRLSAGGDRTILTPAWNKKDGKVIVIEHYASGGARTLTLTTGSAGAFRFGSTITSLSATASGKTDYVGCIYNATDDRFDVVSVSKGF
jgi:hypothetical protein